MNILAGILIGLGIYIIVMVPMAIIIGRSLRARVWQEEPQADADEGGYPIASDSSGDQARPYRD